MTEIFARRSIANEAADKNAKRVFPIEKGIVCNGKQETIQVANRQANAGN